MSTTRSIAVRAGIIGGLMFSVHISMPGGGNYPFLWPALAGATAIWMASRVSAVHRLRHGVLTALATSGIVALVGLVAVSVILFVAGHSQFSAVDASSGPHGRALVVMHAGATTATFSALAMAAAIAGALASTPVVWLRHRRSGAPAT